MRRIALFGCVSLLASSLVLASGISPAAAVGDVTKSLTPNAAPLKVTNTADNNVRVKFQGLTGQVVSLATSAGSFVGNCDANLSLLNVDAVTVMAGPVCAGQAGSISGITIPAAGTYEAYITPTAPLVGSMKLAITSTTAIRSITPAAKGIALSIPAGATIDLGFQGSTNHFVSVLATGGNNDCATTYKVVEPGSTDLFSATCAYSAAAFTDATILPKTGVYKLRVVNTAASARIVTFQLWVGRDQTGAIVLNGASQTVNLKTPGQRALFTFAGTTGQHVSVDLTGGSWLNNSCNSRVQLWRPNGTELAASQVCPNGYVDTTALDATGTWTVIVDPAAFASGTATLNGYNVVDQTGAIVLNGASKAVNLTVPGQRASFTFAGTTGQHVSVDLTGGSWSSSNNCNSQVQLWRPNGTELAASQVCPNGYVDTTALDAAGTWTVIVDPTVDATGTATVNGYNVVDQTGAIVLNGASKAVHLAVPGQRASFTFAGASGQSVSVQLTSGTWSTGNNCNSQVQLWRPNGTELAANQFCPNGTIIGAGLDATGTWTIVVDPTGDVTGTASVSATTP